MPSSSLTASTHHVGRAIPEAHTHREPAPPEPSSHWRADPLNRQWTQDSLSLALAQLSVHVPDEGGELAEGELRSDGSGSSLELEHARSLEGRTSAPELWLGRCATDEMLSSPTKLAPSAALPASSPGERASGGGGSSGGGSGSGSVSESRASRMAHQRRARMQQRTAQRHSSSTISPNMISPAAILAR